MWLVGSSIPAVRHSRLPRLSLVTMPSRTELAPAGGAEAPGVAPALVGRVLAAGFDGRDGVAPVAGAAALSLAAAGAAASGSSVAQERSSEASSSRTSAAARPSTSVPRGVSLSCPAGARGVGGDPSRATTPA